VVAPIRPWLTKFEGSGELDGMFVVRRSRAQGRIPHLPILQPNGAGSYAVRLPGGHSDDHPETALYCPDIELMFDDGDVIWLDSRRRLVRSILSHRANANTLLVTERCDNRCHFCSQPPNDLQDVELYRSAAIAILNFDTDQYVGISGGEPTLNRSAFLNLLKVMNSFGNRTKLHVLSNGRNLADPGFATEVGVAANGRDILWGIPLYGHRASLHDALVNAPGAFTETVAGLLNALGLRFRIELRIVPTLGNVAYLPAIVRFVTSSLPGIEVISIMNLEPKGWARTNYKRLYVPVQQQNPALIDAVGIARLAGCDLRLFNYPLCLLAEELRRFAVRSISDWKNYFPPECERCALRTECCGFFASASGIFRETVQVQE